MKTRHWILLAIAWLFQLQFVFAQTNKLYIEPTDCPIGTTSHVAIRLDNQSEVVALQFNIHLPDVVRLADDNMILSEERKADDHTISIRNRGENNYQVIVWSLSNAAFKGNSGTLIELPLEIPDDLEIDKEYPFTFSDVVVSDRNAKNVLTASDPGSIRIVDGNGPDITANTIQLTSDNFTPGGKVSIAWTVQNVGGRATEAGWNEQVYLVDELGNEYFLGRLSCEEILATSGTISRQAEFNLSEYPGVEGTVKAKVLLTPFADLGELPVDAENNEVTSTASLILPKLLTWRINASSIQEAENQEIYCFLNRSGSRLNEETFTLTQSATGRLELPASVTIPQGESGVSFTMKTINDDVANRDSFVVVTVAGNGYPDLKQEIWIEDDETPTLTITAPEERQQEGNTFNLTISRPWATEWPLEVRLSTDHPKRFTFASTVTIPKDAASVEVPVQVVEDDIPDVNVITAVFNASQSGYETGVGFIEVEDDDVPDIDLEITPTILPEGGGPQAAIATLRRTGVTDNKITIKLTDTSNGLLYYPSSSITLDSGETEYQFAIGISDNDQQEGDREVTLNASVYISTCDCSTAGTNVGTVTKKITITDNDGPALTLSSSQTSLIEGKEQATVLTVTRNTSTTDALTVTIRCDRPEEVTYASTVTIPAGESSVDVPVAVKKNDTTEGNRTISFTATADGYSSGTCWAMITDQTLPDAVITDLSSTLSESYPEENIPYVITIGNNGMSPLSKETEISIYLIQNSTSFREELDVLKLQTDLAPGQVLELNGTVTLPDLIGDCHLCAIINEKHSQAELIYANNESETIPLKINSPYKISLSVEDQTYKPGESIVINGQVTGSQVANVPLDLYFINRGYRQEFSIKTDAQGNIHYTFKPEDWQVGHFSVGACYPGEDLESSMATFNIYGMNLSTSKYQCELIANKAYTGEIQINNPGELKLTDVEAQVVSIPSNCTIQFEPISVIESNATERMKFTIVCTSTSSTLMGDEIKIRFSSAEGIDKDFIINYYCRTEKGELISEVPSINTTVTKGSFRLYHLNIANKGAGETGTITVDIPQLSWMNLESPKEMPSLKEGETATIILRLSTTDEQDLNVAYKGNIGVNCANGNGFSLPYVITPVSTAVGSLQIDVCDEYTYNTVEAPHVSGAKIRVTTPTNQLIAEGTTGDDGLYLLADIPEGYYNVEVTEEQHSDVCKGTVLVDPGKLTSKVVNLSYQAIEVSWKVEETQIEDEYEINTDIQFETNVPVPIVVMDLPSSIPAEDLQSGESLIFNITLSNKGLIAAEDVQLLMPTGFSTFSFEPMIQGPFELPAQSAITVPIKVTKTLLRNLDNDPCVGYPGTLYFWDCGTDRKWHRYEAVLQLGTCKDGVPSKSDGGEGNYGPGIGWGFGGPGGSGWFSSSNYTSSESSVFSINKWTAEDKGCEPCQNKFLLDLLQCVKPIKVAVEGVKFVSKSVDCVGSFTDDSKDTLDKLKDCPFTQDIGDGLEALQEIYALYSYLIEKIANGGDLSPTEKEMIAKDFQETASSAINDLVDHYAGQNKDEVAAKRANVIKALSETVDALKNLNGIENPAEFLTNAQDFFSKLTDLLGEFEKTKELAQKYKKFLTVWKKFDCITPLLEPCNRIEPMSLRANSNQEYPSYIQEFQQSLRIVQDAAIAEDALREEILGDPVWMSVPIEQMMPLLSYLNEFTDKLDQDKGFYLLRPSGISIEQLEQLKERWYNTFAKYQTNGENSIDFNKVKELLATSKIASDYLKETNYTDFTTLLNTQLTNVQAKLEESQESVCSSISLQFSQTMTMTRQAFRGTLTVFNGHETLPMEDVRLNLEVTDEEGNIATSREFQINTESLDIFTGDLEGGWSLDAQKTGTATILFIPSKYAAPTEEKLYSFGGTLSYLDPFTGLEVTRDLFPVTLTVKPSPNLKLTYFMQRDILGDDPLTVNKVEPSVPAEFALLIQNTGAGDATNVNMVTNQPEIVDNEKGLAIDFELFSSTLNGEEESLALGGSVTTAFGTIPAGQTSYAQWWFRSSLLGHFTDYEVTATHVTSYDNPDLSLLDGDPTIHELIRSVRVPDSDLTGFLVNDLVDAEDQPDMIYLTDGTVQKVNPATGSITSNSDSKYTLTVTPSASGWIYGSITDPTGGAQKLVSIKRGDGTEIDLQNIWQTNCTLRDGKEPLYENRIHFADNISGMTTYELTFEPGPSVILAVSSFEGMPSDNEVAEKPVTELIVHFNKAINPETFTVEDLTLIWQGEQQEVTPIVITQQDEQTYVLDLTEVTKLDGYYVLTVQTAEIEDLEGFYGTEGKSASWTQYLAPGYQTLSMELSAGWNWISTNMEGVSNPIALLTPIQEKVKRMQNQTQEITHDPNLGLIGNLESISPETFYKLEMNADGQIDITGTALSPNQVRLDLKQGWNWIGYIPRSATSPTKALALLTADVGDEVKGQEGFAQFNGTTWIGTLEQMEPGKGYMYRAKKAQSFQYPIIGVSVANAALRSADVYSAANNPIWAVDIHKYPNNMSVIADLWADGIKQEPDVYTVAAFCGDECRGIGEYVDGKLFMTVYGEGKGETITFRAVRDGQSTQWAIRETIAFTENTQGSLEQPFALNLTNQVVTGILEINRQTGIYPNPVSHYLYIKGDVFDIRQVRVVNTNGAVLFSRELDENQGLDVSTLVPGMYILIIDRGDVIESHKFIKK